ncbi:hypothetical protein O3P69_010788 [Scylla paramamosain]|uniref:Uncharacterized protein n=1 Tax=Scylla paramamosain TaxID=85552 RepID=A0AAW0TGX2_SCYPA
MATPNRPVVRTCRSPAIASRGLTSALAQARAVIQVQQQALSSLQAGLTAADSSGHGGHPARQPLTSAPEKCEIEMTSATFRTWRRSMTAWMQLCKFPPREAVQHIRLTCVPALQRAVDTRYTDAQWSALTPEEALDALGKLVLRPPTKRPLWADFFDVAAARTPAAPSRKNLPPCGYCGDSHAPGRSNCPARTVTCSYCNKVGHMKKCCRSRRGHPASASKQAAPASPLSEVSSAVTVADAHSTPQPTIDVIVSREDGKEERKASAVADTGAQVCVAGPSLLHTLGIEPSQLQSRAGLRDVANPTSTVHGINNMSSHPGETFDYPRRRISCRATRPLRAAPDSLDIELDEDPDGLRRYSNHGYHTRWVHNG